MPRQGQIRVLNGKKYHYDRKGPERVIDFFETFIHFTEGEWAGLKWEFLKWQTDDVIKPFFGWLREDGTRQYREIYIETPKKSGKSELGAGLALNALLNDSENTPEVYSAAAEREQASICWKRAAMMVELEPHLASMLKCFPEQSTSYHNHGVKQIACEANHGVYKSISAEGYSKHGYHISACIFDEMHQQPNSELYTILKKGTAARSQPQFWIITNSGDDQTSICYQKHQEALRVMADQEADPELLGVVFGASYEADWTKKRTWKKAHPSFGITVKEDFYEAEVKRALANPLYENDFRRYMLGQWVSQSTRWMPMHRWDKCGRAVDPEALRGRQCWAGLDLAQVQDLAALVLVFPPIEHIFKAEIERLEAKGLDSADIPGELTRKGWPAGAKIRPVRDQIWDVLPFAWIPEERVAQRSKDDQIDYSLFVRNGLLETTPGDVVDFRNIEEKIKELEGRYYIRQLAVDWNQAAGLIINLNEWYTTKYARVDDGEKWAVVCRQGYALSSAMKYLLSLVLQEQIAHGGNSLLRWNFDNMVAKKGRNDEIMPDRAMARKKIDVGVATIMAIKAAIDGKGPDRRQRPSSYNTRGILTIEDLIREDEELERANSPDNI